ncbi:MAG: Coenzyme F420 hydrogenase/dehydrogenase, beta subunit C-terminal domain [Desulfotomaculaceae bacterium]|nr:Coenzyme F420 hydrogenase/dehydrogenase, beta subunit C-terminal domain [Desulfotomaculaceae bacterium]
MGECGVGNNSAARLKKNIISTGLCSGCGACIGYCPYIKCYGERVAVIHDCKISEGTCYRICPRASTKYADLRKETFGSIELDMVLGNYEMISFARACDESIRRRGQYGGVVTALSILALETGIFDCALMTGGNFNGAKPIIAACAGDMLACAGSKYTASPNLSLFQEAVKKGFKNIGVIGRPCQVTAARKMQQVTEIKGEKISFIIGLFCMGSFSPEFYQFIKFKGLDKYEIMDIPGDVVFKRKSKETCLPFEEIREYIRDSCLICYDPLSELADLSVGSTESDYGWNTLITRTAKGVKLVEHAIVNGVIEIKEYPGKLLPLLRKAVFNKKKRVLERPDATYLKLSAREKEFFLVTGGGSK